MIHKNNMLSQTYTYTLVKNISQSTFVNILKFTQDGKPLIDI